MISLDNHNIIKRCKYWVIVLKCSH